MNKESAENKLPLFPFTTIVKQGHLDIAGCDTTELVKEYGTPLYVFDEFTLRSRCQEFKKEFQRYYPDTLVTYASKAFLNSAIIQILKEENFGLDVVSGGELNAAHSSSFPLEKICFHGNNKTIEELKLALHLRVGRIIVDNLYELELLDKLAGEENIKQKILLRIAPGVDAHTHRYTTTGLLDSKFGFPLSTGQAESAIVKAISAKNLSLIGLHFHLGSPVRETLPYELAIDLIIDFAKNMEIKHKFRLSEFSPGGGFAVRYTLDQEVLPVAEYAKSITSSLEKTLSKYSLKKPLLIIEPGRAIVAQAAVSLYTVGAIKEIPGIRKYICIDGGMGDNIRPALYESKYEAVVASRLGEPEIDKITIAGKYCESGDILARDITIAAVAVGDIIAMPVAGAYAIPMSSNYNMVPRPAIVMVKDGKSRLIRKRETYQDLMRLDII